MTTVVKVTKQRSILQLYPEENYRNIIVLQPKLAVCSIRVFPYCFSSTHKNPSNRWGYPELWMTKIEWTAKNCSWIFNVVVRRSFATLTLRSAKLNEFYKNPLLVKSLWLRLFLETFIYFWVFPDLKQKNVGHWSEIKRLDIELKVIGIVVATAFYVSRESVCEKTNFSKIYKHIIFFRVWERIFLYYQHKFFSWFANTAFLCKRWWSYHDHGMNHGKQGDQSMIMALIIATMPRIMVTMPSSWHAHGHVSPWACFDYGMVAVFFQPEFYTSLFLTSIYDQFVNDNVPQPLHEFLRREELLKRVHSASCKRMGSIRSKSLPAQNRKDYHNALYFS